MTKYSLLSVILVLSLVVIIVNGEKEQGNKAKTDIIETNVEENEEQELIKAIRRGMLAELILKQKYADEPEADFDETDFEEYKPKEKRFPKWRSGETRSKVKLLHQTHSSPVDYQSSQNNHQNDYSPLLRKIWENNMLEKNRMYQNLLG